MSGGLAALVDAATAATPVPPQTPTIGCGDVPVVSLVCDTIGETVLDTVFGAGDLVLGPILRVLAGAAGWLIDQVLADVMATSTVDVRQPWFAGQYARMTAAAAGLALLGVLLSSTSVLVYREAGRLRRTVTALLTAGVGTATAAAAVALLVDLADALTAWVLGAGPGSGDGLRRIGALLAAPSLLTGPKLPTLVLGLVVLVALVSCLLIWLLLLMRAAAVGVCVALLPVAFATATWEPAGRWLGRLVRTLLALIFTKFVVATTLTVGMAGLADADGMSSILGAAALLPLTSFMPFAVFKLLGVFDDATGHNAFEGAASRMFWHSVSTATTLAQLSAMRSMRAGRGSAAGGGSRRLPPPRAGDRMTGPSVPVAPTRPGSG